jgi:hypothetical protein
MRKIYFSIVCAVLLIVFAAPVKAQVHISLNVNIANQPAWGPVGYEAVQYYYLPDIETYYCLSSHRFYYFQKGRWINSLNLPVRYRNYDLYGSYKVVVNEPTPWKHHDTFRDKYASFKGRHDQQPIRDSHESKYFVNKNHPEHNNWLKQQRQNNGNRNVPVNGNNNGKGNPGNNGNKGYSKGNPANNGNTGNKGNGNRTPGNRGNTDNKGHEKGNPGNNGNTDNKGRERGSNKESGRPE